jgi:lactoylglutathione lyase
MEPISCSSVDLMSRPANILGMRAKFFYTGVRVKDLEASVGFYTTLLGMKERSRNTNAPGKGTVVELINEDGGNTLELNYYEKGSRFDTKYEVGEGLDHLAFVVKDLDAALEEAEKAGHQVVQKMQEPGSRYAYIEDPNGIWIELCQFG